MVLSVLDGGLDLLCEKPLAVSVEECDEMIRAWRTSRSVFMCGLQMRWHPLHQKIRELIQSGKIGQVVHVAATEFRRDWKKIVPASTRATLVNWRHFEALSGGALLEKHCHDFDIFSFWLERNPVRVCGFGGTGVYRARETLDHASVVVEYEGGTTVSLDFNICTKAGGNFEEWFVVGTRGRLRFQRQGDRLEMYTWEPKEKRELYEFQQTGVARTHRGTSGLWQEFLECLRTRRLPSTNPLVARQSVRVAKAAEEAVRTRSVVELS